MKEQSEFYNKKSKKWGYVTIPRTDKIKSKNNKDDKLEITIPI